MAAQINWEPRGVCSTQLFADTPHCAADNKTSGMLDTSSDVGGQAADRAQPAGTSSHPQRGPAETAPEVMLTANTTDSGAAPPNEVAQAGTADWESGQFVFPGFPPGGSGEDESAASPELRHAVRASAWPDCASSACSPRSITMSA